MDECFDHSQISVASEAQINRDRQNPTPESKTPNPKPEEDR